MNESFVRYEKHKNFIEFQFGKKGLKRCFYFFVNPQDGLLLK